MQMPSRKYQSVTLSSAEGYRYGFNGKEKDKEINSQTAYDYGFRIYNPAIGKFLSVDPLMNSYPWYTPYQFAGNTPIVAIDLDGLEEYVVTNYYDKYNKLTETKISIVTDRKNGKRVNPVSYTHLDVYKRQGEWGRLLSVWNADALQEVPVCHPEQRRRVPVWV